MKMPTAITETYQLPSKGILYGKETDGEITVRSMTTFEEKMRLGNQGFWKTMVNILNAVVVSPEGFDASDLTLFDFYFLMYKMRTVSYGPTYKVQVTCPHCGKTQIIRVNLDDIPVTYLPEDFKEPFDIGPLPRSGDTLSCRFLRVADSIKIDRKVREILRDNPDYQGSPEYILNLQSEILSVNGEEALPVELDMYVEKMSAMDSAYFNQKYNEKVNGIGLEIGLEETCENCGELINFTLPFNSEFFRPTFD